MAEQQTTKTEFGIDDTPEVIQVVPEQSENNEIKKDGSVPYTGTGDGYKDEDDMVSDSPYATASQQSIKAFVDDSIAAIDTETEKLVDSFTAGESISEADAVFVADGTETIASPASYDGGDTAKAFGKVSAYTKLAQSFEFADRANISSVKVFLKKVNTPVDNVLITIEADSSGEPSGTPLATATLDGSTLTTSAVEKTIALDTEIQITPSTTYWIVFDRSTAGDNTDYYSTQIGGDGTGYTDGTALEMDISSWADTSKDISFDFIIPVDAGKVYKTRAAFSDMIQFIGFADADALRNAAIDVTVRGIKTKTSWGLTPKSDYYLSDTAGDIGTSEGTYNMRVGFALIATEMLIIDEFVTATLEDTEYVFTPSDNLKASADTERGNSTGTWVKKKEIYVRKGGEIRIKFDLKSSTTSVAHGRIYINGVAIGTDQTNDTTSYITFSEDISGIFPGDLIQLYSNGGGGFQAYVRNFRLYYDITTDLNYTVNTD